MLYAIVAALVILADQLIKYYVSSANFQPMDLIPGILTLTRVRNDGAAFGFLGGEGATMWFIIIAGVFTVLVIIALATRFINGFLARWSIVLVAAGGVSNCIDRVINVRPTGHVVDMFQFSFAKWFPVFNLADVFISVFCVVFIFAILFGRNRKKEEDEDEFVEDEEEELEDEVVEPLPKRRGRKARKAAFEDELPEEDEIEPAKPARVGRKARQSKYDEEYEQYKAAQRAQQVAQQAVPQADPQPTPTAVQTNPTYNPVDPFAEWERANAARQPEPAPAPVQAAPVRPAVDRGALAADPQYAANPAQPARPVQPVQPAPQPAPKPVRKSAPQPAEESSSFSLDDILAEFK